MVTSAWRTGLHPWRNALFQTRFDDQDSNFLHLPWHVGDGPDALLNWTKAFGPLQCLVVLAGRTPATGTDMSENIVLARQYVRAAKAAGIPRVLLASSSAVYGAHSDVPYREDAICDPTSEYGVSKLEMENCIAGLDADGVEVCCLRIGNVLGADALMLNAAAGRPITIDCFENGHGPLRSYIGSQTLSHILGQLATTKSRLPFLLNVADPNPIYMSDLADRAGIQWIRREAKVPQTQNITLDCSLLESLIALKPKNANPADMVRDWTKLRST